MLLDRKDLASIGLAKGQQLKLRKVAIVNLYLYIVDESGSLRYFLRKPEFDTLKEISLDTSMITDAADDHFCHIITSENSVDTQ